MTPTGLCSMARSRCRRVSLIAALRGDVAVEPEVTPLVGVRPDAHVVALDPPTIDEREHLARDGLARGHDRLGLAEKTGGVDREVGELSR